MTALPHDLDCPCQLGASAHGPSPGNQVPCPPTGASEPFIQTLPHELQCWPGAGASGACARADLAGAWLFFTLSSASTSTSLSPRTLPARAMHQKVYTATHLPRSQASLLPRTATTVFVGAWQFQAVFIALLKGT